MSSITFFSETISFALPNEHIISEWISDTISKEEKTATELSYIFCTDDYLHNINLTYLNHDTYTDIITFDYTEKNQISGDIFISIDRVKENAVTYRKTFENELHRVIIHGVLHLLGYKDKTADEAETMRAKEDFYLSLLSI